MTQRSTTNSEKFLLDNEIGLHDAVLLDPMDTASFVENLRVRYENDKIYVSSMITVATFVIF